MWGRLAPDRALLQRAYSLDGVAEELLFVSGPLLVGLLLGAAPPTAGIITGTVLMAAGAGAFVRSPAVRVIRPAERKADKPATAHDGASRPATAHDGASPGALRGIVRPVVASAGVGLALGVVDLVVVAFAEQGQHGDDAVAWTLAALSAGSAVGGLLNGAVAWRVPARARLALTLVGLGLALGGAGLAPGLGVLAVALACAGFFVAPTVVAGGAQGAGIVPRGGFGPVVTGPGSYKNLRAPETGLDLVCRLLLEKKKKKIQ